MDMMKEIVEDAQSVSDTERMAEPVPTESVRPNGGILAALVAAGIGCATLGIMVVIAEASKGFKDTLTFYEPAGSLTGKTTVAVLVWVAAWLVLHRSLKESEVSLQFAYRTTLVLVMIGLLGTFPPFFLLFASGH